MPCVTKLQSSQEKEVLSTSMMRTKINIKLNLEEITVQRIARKKRGLFIFELMNLMI